MRADYSGIALGRCTTMKFQFLGLRSNNAVLLTLSAVCISIFALVSATAQSAPKPAPALHTAARAQSAPAAAQRPWMSKSLSPRQRADLLIKAMTLDEKILMMHGAGPCPEVWTDKCPMPIKGYVGQVPAIERLGIPHLNLADGRAGVGNKAVNVTLLPAPIAAASSWDVDLLNQFGHVLGKEQWDKGTNVTLSPTIDVVRVPEWGRTFESYGEDP